MIFLVEDPFKDDSDKISKQLKDERLNLKRVGLVLTEY